MKSIIKSVIHSVIVLAGPCLTQHLIPLRQEIWESL